MCAHCICHGTVRTIEVLVRVVASFDPKLVSEVILEHQIVSRPSCCMVVVICPKFQVPSAAYVCMAYLLNACLQHPAPTPSLQEQYIFIHDAILESVTCGDTQIMASDLRDALEKIQMDPQSGATGLVSQFQVKH